MTRHSHRLIGLACAYVLGYPLIPAFIGSTLADIDVKWMRGNSLLTAHRGITHHVILAILLILFALFFENKIFTSFVIGYISHLIADIMTISGIPYWTNRHRIALKLFKTGSIGEYLFVSTLLMSTFLILAFTGSIYVPVDGQLILEVIRYLDSNVRISI